jgi:hypothetical protein
MPNSARELAERLLSECGDCEEVDFDKAAALIEADRRAVVAQALAPLRELLEPLRALEASKGVFRAPWTYDRWEIECEHHESVGDCDNPECDGAHVPCTTIESPDEYPDGQVVAQFQVPGLSTFADANGALIVALRNALPELLKLLPPVEEASE